MTDQGSADSCSLTMTVYTPKDCVTCVIASEKIGRVSIVAPEAEQSAVGHSITLYDPIKAHEITREGVFYGYGISGTPADSVKLAIYSLLPRRPDLVISGINNGANLGINVLYSGTVSAATEAAILGVPSMAVSLAAKKEPPFEWALPHVETLARWIINNGLPSGVALNVNIPALPPDQIKGFKLTRQGLSQGSMNHSSGEKILAATTITGFQVKPPRMKRMKESMLQP